MISHEQNRFEEVEVKRAGETVYVDFIEYDYDANGNTVKRTIYSTYGDEVIDFEYDTMNRLVKTTRGTEVTEYYYDNAGNRFMKKKTEYIPFAEIIVDESAIKYITINYEKKQLKICFNNRGKLLIETYSKENIGKIVGVFFNKKIIGYTVFNSIIDTTNITFTIVSDDLPFPY
jgi:hypothetical protein